MIGAAVTTGPVTQTLVLRSEWTKLWSLRSTAGTLAVAAVATIGLGPVVILSESAETTPEVFASFADDGVSRIVYGANITPLIIGFLGVLIFSGEYSTGTIRSTLVGVPRRLPVLWAKAMTCGTAGFAVILTSTIIAFFVCQPLLSDAGVDTSLGTPGMVRAVVGAAVFAGLLGVIGVALGTLLRNTTAGGAALAGVLFALPLLVLVLPGDLATSITPYLPSNAGMAMLTTAPTDQPLLAPWLGLAALCGHAAVALGLAALALRYRDA